TGRGEHRGRSARRTWLCPRISITSALLPECPVSAARLGGSDPLGKLSALASSLMGAGLGRLTDDARGTPSPIGGGPNATSLLVCAAARAGQHRPGSRPRRPGAHGRTAFGDRVRATAPGAPQLRT